MDRPWTAAQAQQVRWRCLVCLVAFHRWVRRRTDDGGGDLHVCARCGKVDDRPDVDPRVQGMGGFGGG